MGGFTKAIKGVADAVSPLGPIAGAAGNVWEGRQNRKQAQKMYDQQRADIAAAQGRLDQYGNQYADWQQSIPVDQLLGMAGGPSTSSSSSRTVQDINQLVAAETAKEDKPLTQMLRTQFEQSLQEPALPPGYLENIARGGAQQIRQLQEGLQNRAAQIGGGTNVQQGALDAILAGSPIIGNVKTQIAQAPLQAEQIMAQRRAAAQGFVDPRLGRRTTGRNVSRTSGSSTSYSPGAAIGNILSIYGTQAPQKPDIILPT